MGPPLSPVIANSYMELLEHKILSDAPLKPSMFLRYTDDTVLVWPHGLGALNVFLDYVNNLPNINFTMEFERGRP